MYHHVLRLCQKPLVDEMNDGKAKLTVVESKNLGRGQQLLIRKDGRAGVSLLLGSLFSGNLAGLPSTVFQSDFFVKY